MSKNLTMRVTAVALAGAMAVGITGCETYGQGAGLGAGVGAAAGAIIGHQSGHALEGAAIGAALGGITGLIAHDIKARKQKEAAETAADYQYEPTQGEVLKFEGAEVLPNTARPGEMIQSNVTYALLGAGAGAEVQEARVLLRGSEQIAELSNQIFTRTDGTWASTQQFRLPNNLARGNYTIETRVRTNKSSISGRAGFYIE